MNFTSHSALHNATTESSEWCESPGMMCASRTFAGRSGSANVHVAVDVIWAPSGNFTVRGVIAVWTLDIGAVDTNNLLVAPESSIAYSRTFFILISIMVRRTFATNPKKCRFLATKCRTREPWIVC